MADNKKNNMMIVIMGEAGAGKDTFAEHIRVAYESEGYAVHYVTFARKLKDQAYLLGWNGKKDKRGRKLLQDLGKVIKNYRGEDYYAKQAFRWCEKNREKPNIWVATDARFLAEIDYCRQKAKEFDADLKIVKIDRSRDEDWQSTLTEEQKKDVSEQEWRQVKPDIVIMNDGKDPTFGDFRF